MKGIFTCYTQRNKDFQAKRKESEVNNQSVQKGQGFKGQWEFFTLEPYKQKTLHTIEPAKKKGLMYQSVCA